MALVLAGEEVGKAGSQRPAVCWRRPTRLPSGVEVALEVVRPLRHARYSPGLGALAHFHRGVGLRTQSARVGPTSLVFAGQWSCGLNGGRRPPGGLRDDRAGGSEPSRCIGR